ncbi:MAG: ATP-binding protein [Candidatus Hydrogenedentota bacterium]
MNTPFYSTTIPSNLEVMPQAVEDAVTSLAEHGWIEGEEVFYARLCLEEAMVNAITHANGEDPGRTVQLKLYDEGAECRIDVQDEGTGEFSPEAVPEPDPAQFRGRGLKLIRYFMNEVDYSQEDRVLTMRFRRNAFTNGGNRDE